MPSVDALYPHVPKVVVVHAGARDSYQVVAALSEANLLERLVTNVYSRAWISQNYGVSLPRHTVTTPVLSLAAFVGMRLFRRLDLHEFSDRVLSLEARRVAYSRHATLLCYSYYAYHAFCPGDGASASRLLYQLHPHPVSVRKILEEELRRVPEARGSLLNEPDLKRTGRAFDQLSAEPELATGIIVASSFTKMTLIENGIPGDRIVVVPYGVDPTKYPPRQKAAPRSGPLRVMWLGQLTQRKGLTYFLDALRRLKGKHITAVIRGRGLVDNALLARYPELSLDIDIGRSRKLVIDDLHGAHLYVLPSLVEGFGQTILEAMSCGLPILATDHTCAADVVRHGEDGFIVPIRSSEAIAERLEWCLDNRDTLEAMGRCASVNAASRSWASFRDGVRDAYIRMSSGVL